MKRDDVSNRYTQAVNHRLAPADAFESDNMRVIGLHCLRHVDFLPPQSLAIVPAHG